MVITFLGTGTSQGVPVIAFPPGLPADLADPHNWRTRSSIHLSAGNYHLQIDASPEFRLQCLHNDIRWIDALLLTHSHADHILGMDDLRRFCDLLGGNALPVYGQEFDLARVRACFPYAITDKPTVPGYPAFKLHSMPLAPETITLGPLTIEAHPLPHGRHTVLGFLITESSTGQRLLYCTDCSRLPDTLIARAQGVHLAILDALRPQPHPSHMHLEKALATAHALHARSTRFTHMTHYLDHAQTNASLPPNIQLAHDGLRLDLAQQ